MWKGNDVTAELTERKKKSLGISSDIDGGFYVSKEDFVKVRLGGVHKLRLQDLAFFDHLPPSVYIFYGIKVYKKSIF